MKLRALGHRVLVKPEIVDEEIKTKTGAKLYMPSQVRTQEQGGVYKGEVVEIGPTAWKDKRLGSHKWCEVGDVVIWPRYAGILYPPGDNPEYCILNDEDLLVAVEEE